MHNQTHTNYKINSYLNRQYFISQHLHNSFDSCVLINDISDHMPSIVNIHDQKHDNTNPLEFKCRSFNDKAKITELNNLLSVVDWSTLHPSNVDLAFNQFQLKIEESMDKIAPYKHNNYSKSQNMERTMDNKRVIKLHEQMHSIIQKNLNKNASQKIYNKYKTYRNCLTKLKRNAKVSYYVNKCYSLKSNVKKLWQLINSIIKRNK